MRVCWKIMTIIPEEEEEEEEEEEVNAQGVTQSACSTKCTGVQVHCKVDLAAFIVQHNYVLIPRSGPPQHCPTRGGGTLERDHLCPMVRDFVGWVGGGVRGHGVGVWGCC
jgi:hypothetical protein